jgi:hypothetical protein
MVMKDFMMSSEAAMYPRTATGPVAKHVNKRKIIVEYCIVCVARVDDRWLVAINLVVKSRGL